jgi:hypothetical protein
VFSTIQVLMRGSVLPPRLRAALHGALAAIPGVHFAKDVTDAAGRHGVALYGNDLAFCARRQVTTDPVPLRMIRSSRCPLSIIDLTYAYSFCHQDSLAVTRPKTTIRTACHATTGQTLSDAA